MSTNKKAGYLSYAMTPIMGLVANILASLLFVFVLKVKEPAYVFMTFATVSFINMSLFAILPQKKKDIARKINMILYTLTLMVLFGTLGRQNFQLESFFFSVFSGLFTGAIVHFFMAKIAGPLFMGRGWCGWSCWTAALLDLLPYKQSSGWKGKKVKNIRYLHFLASLVLVSILVFGFKYIIHDANPTNKDLGTIKEMVWFVAGYMIYYVLGIILALKMKDNRAFCKYLCPVTVFLKASKLFSILRIKGDKEKCNDCGICIKECLMDIDIPAYTKNKERVKSTECIMCMKCIAACPESALKSSIGIDFVTQERLKVNK